jgi:hypothetical protein
MKLELVATLLKKDAKGVREDFKISEDQTEIPDDILIQKLDDFIKLEKTNSLLEGKKQVEGMNIRLGMEKAEKALKGIGIDGSNFDEMIEFIKTKNSGANPDAELLKKNSLLALKLEQAEKDKNELLSKFGRINLETSLSKKLEPVLKQFTFATDNVKTKALKDFIASNGFLENEGDVFLLDTDKKPTNKLEEKALEHFSEWGLKNEDGVNPPPNRKPGKPANYGTTLEELYTSLRTAKTPEERATILEKISKHA